ncbi:MAG: hypothetical protein KAG64_08970 [Bacteroidales bacterium]|nr:hypothetical protein [Bacteroidales bacterium]
MRKALLIAILILFQYNGFSQEINKPKQYVCYHIDHELLLDGDINEAVWQKAKWTDDFMDIQGPEQTQPTYQTRVKMLWSDSFLYVAAYMQEPHIWAKITEDEKIMYVDNDFEIFIDPNGDNHNYYEFEFNALNKKWDLFLERPYRDKVKPDLKWNCKGLRNATKVYGTINKPKGKEDSAWTMEIAIPLNCIDRSVNDQHIWRINFSRVQWETKIRGKKYIKLKQAENNWVWSPQWAIDMHRPEYWGYLQFSKEAVGTKTVVPRPDALWDIKRQLLQAYYYQKSFYRKHQYYSDTLPEKLAQHLVLNRQNTHFIISYEQDWKKLNINEKGRIWRTKMEASPRFWMWMHPYTKYSDVKWDSVFAELNDIGIRGVLMGTNTRVIKRVIPIAQKYNIQIHAWMWALNRADAPKELMSVNANGKSLAEEKAYVNYYKFMSPIIKETHRFIDSNIAQLERIDGLSGIHLDYIRYVDVFLPKGLLPKYNLVQDSIMPEFDYGYHPAMVKAFNSKYGKLLYDMPDYANDSLWQQFRMNQVTEIVNSTSNSFFSKELKLSAAVFPDQLMSRRMVLQDWGVWNLDYYFPMVYNGFYNAGTYWVEQRMKVSRSYLPTAKIFCGLYLPDNKSENYLLESMAAAIGGGASGIAFFDYGSLKDDHKKAIQKITQQYGEWVK